MTWFTKKISLADEKWKSVFLPVRNFCNKAHKHILNIWKCKIFFKFSNERFQRLRILVKVKYEHDFLNLKVPPSEHWLSFVGLEMLWWRTFGDLCLLKKLRKCYISSRQLYIIQKLYLCKDFPYDSLRTIRVDSGRENRSESPYLCKRVQVRENDKIQRTELVLKPSVYDQLDICNRQIFEAPQMGKIRIPQC